MNREFMPKIVGHTMTGLKKCIASLKASQYRKGKTDQDRSVKAVTWWLDKAKIDSGQQGWNEMYNSEESLIVLAYGPHLLGMTKMVNCLGSWVWK